MSSASSPPSESSSLSRVALSAGAVAVAATALLFALSRRSAPKSTPRNATSSASASSAASSSATAARFTVFRGTVAHSLSLARPLQLLEGAALVVDSRSGTVAHLLPAGAALPNEVQADHRVVELGRRFLVPGFVDTHTHAPQVRRFAALDTVLRVGSGRLFGSGFAHYPLFEECSILNRHAIYKCFAAPTAERVCRHRAHSAARVAAQIHISDRGAFLRSGVCARRLHQVR
jgi:hypothetical protein